MGLCIWRKEDYQEIEKSKCGVPEATMIREKKAWGEQEGAKKKISKRCSQKGKWEEEE